MRPDDVAIFHDSQSRKAAPPQWSASRAGRCVKMRLPNPSGTRNIMAAMPVVTPRRQGTPRRTPTLAPAVVSMMLLGPGVMAATTAKRRKGTACSFVVRYLHRVERPARPRTGFRRMPPQETRSGGGGLERSCGPPPRAYLWSTGPAGGVELLRAWFAGPAYQKHRHDTYAVGVTDCGVQVFDYRGAIRASTPGQVVVLYPDEVHDGRAGTDDGFGYRIIYADPSHLLEAVRVVRGRPEPLPFVSEPVSTNPRLSQAVAEAFRAPLDSLAVDGIVVDLVDGLFVGAGGGGW